MEVKYGGLNHKCNQRIICLQFFKNIEIAVNDTDNWNDDQKRDCNK
jgi:hypothetical protein